MKRGTNHYYVDAAGDVYYPTAAGDKTATSTSSALYGARNTRVAGILVTAAHTSATTITLYTDDGNGNPASAGAITGMVFTIPASQACPFPIPLGDCDGVKIPGALGVEVSNSATKCIVFYDKIS